MSANSEHVLDQLWADEAHNRLDAYDRGELQAVSADELFDEIERNSKKSK